jgi:NAD(P)-dependent dehydrogenase (short-subunit alcohol dehydrogenase family)
MNTVLIVGGRGGVGNALAERFLARDLRVALAGRGDAPADLPEGATWIQADASTAAGAERAVAAAAEAFGAPPYGVVNAAGSILVAPIVRTNEVQYRDTLAANLDSAFFLTQAYVAALQKQKRAGAIVLFSSVAARIGLANHAAIAIAKAGVEALVRSLAADVSAQGIRINAIAPGLLDTPLGGRFLNSEAMREQMAAQYPLGRVGTAEDAAALAEFLLSDAAAWITGQVIGLDGGFTAVRPPVRKPA